MLIKVPMPSRSLASARPKDRGTLRANIPMFLIWSQEKPHPAIGPILDRACILFNVLRLSLVPAGLLNVIRALNAQKHVRLAIRWKSTCVTLKPLLLFPPNIISSVVFERFSNLARSDRPCHQHETK
jgi:hypothetical protein